MPLLHAFYLGIATLVIAAITARGRVHPVLAVIVAAAGFAYASGMSVSLLGKVFGTGFGQTLNALGLPVLASAMVSALAARSFASEAVFRASSRLTDRGKTVLVAALGLAAGTGASTAASFAVLSPLRDAVVPGRRGALTLGLALSAGQGLLLPSPVVIAATAILAADWRHVLAFGVPAAMLSAAAGAIVASRVRPETASALPPATRTVTAGASLALPAACLLMALMLIVQSVGDIPSEPFGGGGAREMILGTGRPLILLLAGVAVMLVGARGWRGGGLSETGWAAKAIGNAAPLMLLLGAAGGLQSLAQTSHMAEMLAEKVLPLSLGLAVPFLAAAIMKTLQGASLVAAITAAGMVQPLLPALGLESGAGRALAVLAVGAGAMTVSHVNDGLFWLTADAARLRPGRALALFSSLTALQGAIAIVALTGISLFLIL
jgi:GntP family gluconate:H+ symporter